jgi:hypothetical protein
MAFTTIPGFDGSVYIPDQSPDQIKKHDCQDCFSCQMCSDERCEQCLMRNSCEKKKL